MRVVLFAQKPIGERCFRYLKDSSDRSIKLVGACSNEKPQGTWWQSAGIAAECSGYDVPFLPSETANNSATEAFVSKCKADAIISVQHPRLIPQGALDLVEGRAFNLHLAPLPEYRGYFGINHAMINRDLNYRVTIHWMTQGADEGDIDYEASLPISANETAVSLYSKAVEAGFGIFISLIEDLGRSVLPARTRQQPGGRFYDRHSLDRLREIRPPFYENEIALKTRAFHFAPFEPAYLLADGMKITLVPVKPVEQK